VRAALAGTLSGTRGFEQLLAAHEGVSTALEKLLRSSYDRTEATRQQVEEATWRQAIEDRVLLVACLLASCLYLWTGTRIYYRMSQQSEELNQVSWQLLEKQELLAQRLSRDLHDELGQSLTALKANFSRHAAAGCMDPSWMQDCSDLLKESIRSAHEISQLLRPTLLDDFGLDSALAWLCERFEERNKIRVNYQSDYHWRLDEQAETHVFRIAQEALTNVVRHAEASVVEVHFSKQHGVVRLKISDNGVGLKTRPSRSLPSLGLIGMKARARSLEGEMRLQSAPGEGVAIEVVFPANPAS
jgi:signal transduction histidine kinase